MGTNDFFPKNKTPENIEHRKYIRLNAVFPVEFQFIDSETSSSISDIKQGFTRDVSKSGICLEINNLEEGLEQVIKEGRAKIDLRLHIPLSMPETKAIAKIAWHEKIKSGYPNKYLIGLSFLQIDPKDRNRIYFHATRAILTPAIIAVLFFFLVSGIAYFYTTGFKSKADNIKLAEEMSQLSAKKSELEKNLLELDKEHEEIESKIALNESKINKYKAQIKDLEKVVTDTKTKDKLIAYLEDDKEKTKKIMKHVLYQRARFNQKMRDLGKENVYLKNRVSRLSNQKVSTEDNLKDLLASFDTVEEKSIFGMYASMLKTISLTPYSNSNSITLGSIAGNFDGEGYAFSESNFPIEEGILTCPVDSVGFVRLVKNNKNFDSIECRKEEIKLLKGRFKNIHLLAASHHGNQKDIFGISYSDGTIDKISVEIDDWWNRPIHGHVANSGFNTKEGETTYHRVYLSHIKIACDDTKNIKSLILPNNSKICIFAVSLTTKDIPFELRKDLISLNNLGYKTGDKKVAILSLIKKHKEVFLNEPVFTISEAYNPEKIVFKDTPVYWGRKWGKELYIADFSSLKTSGEYMVKFANINSAPFHIDENLYKDKINITEIFKSFFKTQRCEEEKISQEERKDYYLMHKDIDINLQGFELEKDEREKPLGIVLGDYFGGWHDAASTDKETVKIAYTAQILLFAYENNPSFFEKDKTKDMPFILEEAGWGLDYLLKLQDKDGGVFLAVKPYDAWNPNSLPRRIIVNKGTGVTAKAVSAWMTGYRIFNDARPEIAEKYLKAAKKGWEFIKNNPDNYILDDMYPSYWTGNASDVTSAALESYLALKNIDPKNAKAYLKKTEGDLKNGDMSKDGIWSSAFIKAPGSNATRHLQTLIDEQIIITMAKVYKLTKNKELKNKIKSDLNIIFNNIKKGTKEPYMIPENFITTYFGMNGWLAQIAMDVLVAGQSLEDPEMIQSGKNMINWVLGNNPFGKSAVVGIGSMYYDDPYGRPFEKSIGGVIPGIIANNSDGIPEDFGAQDWQVKECTVDYTGALIYDISILDKL